MYELRLTCDLVATVIFGDKPYFSSYQLIHGNNILVLFVFYIVLMHLEVYLTLCQSYNIVMCVCPFRIYGHTLWYKFHEISITDTFDEGQTIVNLWPN